jgi:hypothetical protein
MKIDYQAEVGVQTSLIRQIFKKKKTTEVKINNFYYNKK